MSSVNHPEAVAPDDYHLMLTQWYRLAPIVFAYFKLDKEGQAAAVDSARRNPHGALVNYRSIVNSLRPDWRYLAV